MAACTRTLFFFAFFVSAVSIGMVDGARPKMMTVAGLFPMSGGWSGGIHVLPAANLTINLVNAMDDILPHTTLKMVAADTQCNANRGLMSLLDLFAVQGNDVDVILGAGCSSVCEPITFLSNAWDIAEISYACTSPKFSDKFKYPNFLRTSVTDQSYAPAWVDLCLKFGWTRVATVAESSDLFVLTISAFAKAAAAAGIEVVSSHTVTGEKRYPMHRVRSEVEAEAKGKAKVGVWY